MTKLLYDPMPTKYAFPKFTDGHYLVVKKNNHAVFDENFVYVVRSGVAEKRRVRVLCEDNGSCIVAADGGEGYLAAGENILVTWRSVYEGKELNR